MKNKMSLTSICIKKTAEIISRIGRESNIISPTEDGGLSLIYYIKMRDKHNHVCTETFELEIFNDGDIVFVLDDNIKDIHNDKELELIISLINGYIELEELEEMYIKKQDSDTGEVVCEKN